MPVPLTLLEIISIKELSALEDTTSDYVDALKQKSMTEMIRTIDEHLSEAKTKSKIQGKDLGFFLKTDEGKKILTNINKSLKEQKEKISKGLDLIADAEIHNAQNHGAADGIIGMAKSIGVDDPIVFKIGVMDSDRCKVCWKLWTLEDKVTPRVYKMSELAGGFSSAKAPLATIGLSHPRCRDILTFLAPGFGFEGGKIVYKGKDHDEYKAQRE